jgi:hypothetical protein
MAKRANPTDAVIQQIRTGTAPSGVTVRGKLSLAGDANLQSLPEDLTVGWLELSNCVGLKSLPRGLKARRITLAGQGWDPTHLLAGLRCYHLELQNSAIQRLPDDLSVEYQLDLEGCVALESLPDGLKVGCLNLRGCTSLRELPEDLECYFLDIFGCTSLDHWPQRGNVSVGRLAMRGCLQMKSLPEWLKSIAQLDLRDCVGMSTIPDWLSISSWLDVAGTRIRSLPHGLQKVQLRWRGVAVDQRIAFFPETITSDEILREPNAEKRRVLLERMGYETFLSHAKAETLDADRDAGGPRRLLKVEMQQDEPLVCVSVICPSTGRQYVIRVPPTMTSCHQAVAWVAGFDDPDKYQPLAET